MGDAAHGIRPSPVIRRSGLDASLPVLVLVHGIGMSHHSFGRLARALRGSFRLVAIDLPGFGDAPSPRRSLGVEGHAAAVATALDRASVGECVVVGHSMGAQVAVELARTRPERVSSVVLIGPVIDDRRRSLPRQVVALLGDTLRERPSVNLLALTDYLRSVTQVLREVRSMLAYPLLARVRGLAAPVLVVRGLHDPIVRSDWARRLTAAAPAGSLVELPGPHHIQEHAPAAVARAITDFVHAPLRGRAP